MNCIDVVFTKPENKKGSCPNVSVEFYAPPTDKGGCNNISVVFESIIVDNTCSNTLFWDIQSSTGFTLVIKGSGSVVLDGTEEALDISKSIADGVEIAFCDSANVTEIVADNGGISGNIPPLVSSLQFFWASNNNLDGNIPSFSANLKYFWADGNNLDGNIPSFGTNLQGFNARDNNLSSVSDSAMTSCRSFSVEYNALGQTDVDVILKNLAANTIDNGSCYLKGNAEPSTAGESHIDTLRARGWTVSVEGGY